MNTDWFLGLVGNHNLHAEIFHGLMFAGYGGRVEGEFGDGNYAG